MKLAIGGDVSVMCDCEELFDKCQTRELFNDVLDAFATADRCIVNLETAVTNKDTPIKKIGPNLKAPLNTVRTLMDAGVTDCILSNNHIFDFGKEGIKDTIFQLNKYGMGYTGFGADYDSARENMVISDGNKRVEIIAVCEHEYSYALKNRMGARAYDPYDTNDDIAEAKCRSDFVIVIYHGGKEDCRYPSPRLLKACRSMVKHGADLVLCQHSHCIGCYEKYMDGHILYGQGNLHFICKEFENPEDNGYMWNTGLLVMLDLDDDIKIEFIPTVAEGKGIRLAREDEKDRLISELYERSASLNDGTWQDKWRKFALSQQRYKALPQELYEEIAHYFDCEAHTDACKEIYRTLNYTNEID